MTNLREGFRRIKVIGRSTALCMTAVTVGVVAIDLVMPKFIYLLLALLTFRVLVLIGLVLWAWGWIMEGFAMTQKEDAVRKVGSHSS